MPSGPFSLAFYLASIFAHKVGDLFELLSSAAETVEYNGWTVNVVAGLVFLRALWLVKSTVSAFFWW